MAASGLVEESCTAMEETDSSLKNGFSLLEIVQQNGIFGGRNFACVSDSDSSSESSSVITKCLERLNGRLDKVVNGSGGPSMASLGNYFKNAVGKHGFSQCTRNSPIYQNDRCSVRIGRVPSTDSVVVSSAGSEHGSVDSYQCSNSSDTASSVSAPCSPEGPDSPRAETPQPMPPIPASLADSLQESCDESSSSGLCADSSRQKEPFHRTEVECLPNDDDDVGPCFPPKDDDPLSEGDNCWTSTNNTVTLYRDQTNSTVESTTDSSVLKVSGSSSSCDESSLVKTELKSVFVEVVDKEPSFQGQLPEQLSELPSSKLVDTHSRDTSKSSSEIQSSVILCKWVHCDAQVDDSSQLVDHILIQHVETQKEHQSFTCLWAGCKVFDRSSSCLSWLQRHVLTHGGNKPFQCIVEGCSSRFTSQAALERHVNSHFNGGSSSSGSAAASARGGQHPKNDTPTKFVKKKKTRYRRRCMAVKTDDYFDAKIMEHIKHGLLEISALTRQDIYGYPGTITFHSRVIAKRVEESGKVKVLLHWTPENMLPDCWVPESSAAERRTIPLSSLPRASLAQLDPFCMHQGSGPPTKRKRK